MKKPHSLVDMKDFIEYLFSKIVSTFLHKNRTKKSKTEENSDTETNQMMLSDFLNGLSLKSYGFFCRTQKNALVANSTPAPD